jgi:hypothetical protein
MGRVINPDSAGKQRNQHMRTIAELLRRLSQKQVLDDEAKDMVSALVFCFRDIDEGIEVSAAAWEKRDYWMKADELRQRWSWAGRMADELQPIVFENNWNHLPVMIVKMLPYVNDIKITKLTRKEDAWQGSHMRLLRERAPKEG